MPAKEKSKRITLQRRGKNGKKALPSSVSEAKCTARRNGKLAKRGNPNKTPPSPFFFERRRGKQLKRLFVQRGREGEESDWNQEMHPEVNYHNSRIRPQRSLGKDQ